MSIRKIKNWEKYYFNDIIDVRSPSEYLEDHIPGSTNMPVLTNFERDKIGKIYKKESSFKARKLGASYISSNISKHINNILLNKPGCWKPLIYCWRGGQRSKSLATVLSEIGWQVTILEGGYKTYRKKLNSKLNSYIKSFSFIVLKGKTGTAKTRVLHNLSKNNKIQVLNLEELAAHKGSLLGNIPNIAQPSQKMFESLIFSKLNKMKKENFILIEGESSKIGNLFLPKELIRKIKKSPSIEILSSVSQRAIFLCKDYKRYLEDKNSFKQFFIHAERKLGRNVVRRWKQLYIRKDWRTLAINLINEYYDPLYDHKHLEREGKTIKVINMKRLYQGDIMNLCKYLEEEFLNY